MYALHDAVSVVGAAPLVQAPAGPAQQIERRAVESTEQSSLKSEDRYGGQYDSTAAVLQLVEGSAQSFAQMLESLPADLATSESAESVTSGEQSHVDLYA